MNMVFADQKACTRFLGDLLYRAKVHTVPRNPKLEYPLRERLSDRFEMLLYIVHFFGVREYNLDNSECLRGSVKYRSYGNSIGSRWKLESIQTVLVYRYMS